MNFQSLSVCLGLLATASVVHSTVHSNACNADNCANAVTGTRRGPAFPATAKSDCSSFMTTTTTLAPVTVTNTITITIVPGGAPAPTNPPPVKRDVKTVPYYASACSGTSRYSSACSCYGITAQTFTASPSASTDRCNFKTVTVTATATVTQCPQPKKLCNGSCADTSSDPNNCGTCGTTCPSGQCTNGACVTEGCTGSTCDNFSPCGPGGSCVCASITGGKGFCVNGATPCAGLADCGTSADCPLGSVCAVGSCCGRNVCIGQDYCGGFSSPNKRGWSELTLGERMNMAAYLAELGCPSASVAVLGDGVLSTRCYSVVGDEVDTKFQACSISKAINALAVMKLVDADA
ncbi:hypothetical protein PWT90_07802 [Aphanocladium album]|nr:hypothetical protein PWT90_07802 [Aphanocladium album]